MKLLTQDAPATWGAVIVRALSVAVIVFVVLQAKEIYDAGRPDYPGVGSDALLSGVGMFLFSAVLKWSGKAPRVG